MVEILIYVTLPSVIYFTFVFGITTFRLGAGLNEGLLDDVPRGTQTPLLTIALLAIVFPGSKAAKDAKARNINLFPYRVIWCLMPFVVILNIACIWMSMSTQMFFIIASTLSFFMSIGLAKLYIEVKKRTSSLSGIKKDLVRIASYIGLLGMILVQVYVLQLIEPQVQTWIRYLVTLPFLGAFGLLLFKLKQLKEIDKY